MDKQQEELLAAALWSFIERMREQEHPLASGLDGLTAGDAEELASLFHTAGLLRAALDTDGELISEAADERVWTAITAARPAGSSRRQRDPRPSPAQWWPRWGWSAGGVAAALALGLLIGTGLPRPDALSHPPATIRALTHAQTVRFLAAFNHRQLTPSDTRAVLWHLAHCDECFAEYAAGLRPPTARQWRYPTAQVASALGTGGSRQTPLDEARRRSPR